jgi:hypothetical protein
MYHFQVQKMTHMQLWMISSIHVFRSYENCRRSSVAILDMQMSKVPIISGYDFQCGKPFFKVAFEIYSPKLNSTSQLWSEFPHFN